LRIALEPDLDANVARPATSRSALPFLSQEPFAAWRQEPYSALLGKRPRVSFLFHPAHLQKLLTSSPFAALRGADDFPAEALLLQDEMALGELNLAVQAWIVPTAPHSEHVSVFLHVVQTMPVQSGVSVRLLWGDAEYQVPIKDGRSVFADLTPPPARGNLPDSSPEFRLSFELTDDAAQAQDRPR
jgi:hypothetical protein